MACSYGNDEKVAILTANGETLKPMLKMIYQECGIEYDSRRFIIEGAENVPGFEAVAYGDKVDT